MEAHPQSSDTSDSFQQWLQEHFGEADLHAMLVQDTAASGEQAAAADCCTVLKLFREEIQQTAKGLHTNLTGPPHLIPGLEARSDLDTLLDSAFLAEPGMQSLASSSSADQGTRRSKPLYPNRYKSEAQKQAHLRYRDKRKNTVAALETEVQEKVRLVEELQHENTELQARQRMLETAVNASEETLDILRLVDQLSSTCSVTSKSGAPTDHNPADSASTAASAAASTRPSPATSPDGTNNTASADDEQQDALRVAGFISDWDSSMQVYKEYINKTAVLLHKADAEEESAAVYAELEALTWTTINSLKPWLAYKGQELVYQWQGRNLETGEEGDTSALWPHVLQQLQVTQEQARALLACYKMFGVCLSKLVEERQQLAQQYNSVQQQLHAATCTDFPEQVASLGEQLNDSYQLLARMSRNLQAYASLDKVFATAVMRTLTGVQFAKALMHSYPYLPSWHEMISHLHAQVGRR